MAVTEVPARRSRFKVPESWRQEFRAGYAHYVDGEVLQRILKQEFGIRPEVMHTTRDMRGVVVLTLPELYWLIYEPGDQPKLVCTGAKVTAKRQDGPYGSPREVQHAQEIAEMRTLLAEEFGVFPPSMAPSADMRGRVRMHFADLMKIIREDDDTEEYIGDE